MFNLPPRVSQQAALSTHVHFKGIAGDHEALQQQHAGSVADQAVALHLSQTQASISRATFCRLPDGEMKVFVTPLLQTQRLVSSKKKERTTQHRCCWRCRFICDENKATNFTWWEPLWGLWLWRAFYREPCVSVSDNTQVRSRCMLPEVPWGKHSNQTSTSIKPLTSCQQGNTKNTTNSVIR